MMPYERTRLIEQRFKEAVSLIKRDAYNSSQLAGKLNVSEGTIQRIIAELKFRGYVIRSIRDSQGWHYELED